MWIACLFVLLAIFVFLAIFSMISDPHQGTESFSQKERKENTCTPSGVPESTFDPSLSTFDNLLLTTNKDPRDHTLTKVDAVYQGSGLPNATYAPFSITLDPEDTSNPPVDGNPNSVKDKFMFAFNKCKPECCPSTFSCDSGCVCATPEQNDFIATRGNNRHYDIW